MTRRLSLSRRPLFGAFALVALLASLVLLASSVSGQIDPPAVVTQVDITCGGSKLTQTYLQQVALAYLLVAPNVTINPIFGTSSDLQPKVFTGEYDFVLLSSSSTLTAQQRADHPDIVQAPLIGVAAVPMYNVPVSPRLRARARIVRMGGGAGGKNLSLDIPWSDDRLFSRSSLPPSPASSPSPPALPRSSSLARSSRASCAPTSPNGTTRPWSA